MGIGYSRSASVVPDNLMKLQGPYEVGGMPAIIYTVAIHGYWMKVYIDESGNLGGLGSKVSVDDSYFVLAALVAKEEIPIRRCIKKVRQTLPKKYN
jgi:hypothetical protein